MSTVSQLTVAQPSHGHGGLGHSPAMEGEAHENVGNSGRGHSQGVPKIFRAPISRAHCAVIFAIAQLSCYILLLVFKNYGRPNI